MHFINNITVSQRNYIEAFFNHDSEAARRINAGLHIQQQTEQADTDRTQCRHSRLLFCGGQMDWETPVFLIYCSRYIGERCIAVRMYANDTA